MEHLNDWEEKLGKDKINAEKEYNLDTLYEHTHSELSLQQSKRDQIITIYLALFSFLMPFALSLESVGLWMKGLIFLVAGVIGVLFSFINVRYRIYKEVYWLSCQALTVLMNVKKEELNKQTIQRAFFHSLQKKGNAYFVKGRQGKVWDSKTFVKKNTFSSETLHHMIQVLITSVILALSVALIVGGLVNLPLLAMIGIGALVSLVVFALLMRSYFKKLMEVYAVMAYVNTGDPEADKQARNKLFNSTFAKAWTLHVYYQN